MSVTRYAVTATREGRLWLVTVPALELRTKALNRRGVEIMARDVIATFLEVPLRDVAVEVTWVNETGDGE